MNSNEEEKINKLFNLAKITEEAELHEETTKYMEELIKLKKDDLTQEERDLFGSAYKDNISCRRASWRALIDMLERETRLDSQYIYLIQEYKTQIESEIKKLCDHMFSILDNYLINKANSDESKAFYYKLKGDYYRYLAEISDEARKNEPAKKAELSYDEATKIAKNLPLTNYVRLGIALNLSVLFYEIIGDKDKAEKIAKNTISETKGSELKDEASNIYKTINENVKEIWKKDTKNDDDESDD